MNWANAVAALAHNFPKWPFPLNNTLGLYIQVHGNSTLNSEWILIRLRCGQTFTRRPKIFFPIALSQSRCNGRKNKTGFLFWPGAICSIWCKWNQELLSQNPGLKADSWDQHCLKFFSHRSSPTGSVQSPIPYKTTGRFFSRECARMVPCESERTASRVWNVQCEQALKLHLLYWIPHFFFTSVTLTITNKGPEKSKQVPWDPNTVNPLQYKSASTVFQNPALSKTNPGFCLQRSSLKTASLTVGLPKYTSCMNLRKAKGVPKPLEFLEGVFCFSRKGTGLWKKHQRRNCMVSFLGNDFKPGEFVTGNEFLANSWFSFVFFFLKYWMERTLWLICCLCLGFFLLVLAQVSRAALLQAHRRFLLAHVLLSEGFWLTLLVLVHSQAEIPHQTPAHQSQTWRRDRHLQTNLPSVEPEVCRACWIYMYKSKRWPGQLLFSTHANLERDLQHR